MLKSIIKVLHFNFFLFFSLLFLQISLLSCMKNENRMSEWNQSFGEAKKIYSLACLDENMILGRPFLIQYADSSLIIYDEIGDSLFTIIDLATDNKIYRFGQKGEGDNEFLQVFSFCNMASDSLIGVFDIYRHCLREINIRQVKRGTTKFPVLTKDTLSSLKVSPTKYGGYLGLGFYENNMLSLSDSIIGRQYFFEYPYQDSREQAIANRLRGMAYQGTLCSNKALDKFLYAVRSAPIFMMFSITKNAIEKKYEWIGGYPVYKTEQTSEWRAAPISADCKQGFISAYATDNYVYLLYSGRSIREAKMNALQANTIYQLTWDGKPVNKFELDFSATTFCVSTDDSFLYALVNKGELELVKYEIE